MSLNAHDRHVLEAIEERLTSADPRLAAMLSMFGRLTRGEEMPLRERVSAGWRRATRRQPVHPGRGCAVDRGARLAHGHRNRWLWVVLLVWLLATVALAVSALTLSRRAGALGCPEHSWRTCAVPTCVVRARAPACVLR